MKKTWLVAGLAALVLAAPAYAADPVVDGCEKFKADTAKQKDKCVEENAEIAKITCKTMADMNAAMKIYQKCGAKVVAAATSGGAKSGGTTPTKDASTASSTREWKCKAVDPADNKDIAEATAPRLTQCMTALKEKVKATKCTAGSAKTEYLHQNWVIDAWSKPTKATVICK